VHRHFCQGKRPTKGARRDDGIGACAPLIRGWEW
jgi:hypothetical protein